MAHILLADDDEATRDLVKRALESDGHNVDLTQDGSEALDVLTSAAKKFDLLVSDVHMPGIDGIDLARRAISSAPDLKLLLMSGFAEELERAKALNSPNLGIILKPFTLEQIRAAVRTLLA
ncbi:response regulator [Hyphomicrobium sp.]|uniref:response regulator n=1 Tax=Hyphomicrobium sp. TaxID=82 RepID=UPI002E3359C5|nr:response regulator [Hyphomicrobium sp.]HEX2841449.1 response regulator [Hyphomicrobium sp.]